MDATADNANHPAAESFELLLQFMTIFHPTLNSLLQSLSTYKTKVTRACTRKDGSLHDLMEDVSSLSAAFIELQRLIELEEACLVELFRCKSDSIPKEKVVELFQYLSLPPFLAMEVLLIGNEDGTFVSRSRGQAGYNYNIEMSWRSKRYSCLDLAIEYFCFVLKAVNRNNSSLILPSHVLKNSLIHCLKCFPDTGDDGLTMSRTKDSDVKNSERQVNAGDRVLSFSPPRGKNRSKCPYVIHLFLAINEIMKIMSVSMTTTSQVLCNEWLAAKMIHLFLEYDQISSLDFLLRIELKEAENRQRTTLTYILPWRKFLPGCFCGIYRRIQNTLQSSSARCNEGIETLTHLLQVTIGSSSANFYASNDNKGSSATLNSLFQALNMSNRSDNDGTSTNKKTSDEEEVVKSREFDRNRSRLLLPLKALLQNLQSLKHHRLRGATTSLCCKIMILDFDVDLIEASIECLISNDCKYFAHSDFPLR